MAHPASSVFPAGLSGREVEVLRLVVAGKSNREIAQTLIISEKTVANHLANIFAKTGADNRAAATAFAIRHSLA
jgi:DNA-binding CsgD family transcriptional regulator